MRRALLLAVLAAGMTAIAGCPKKPTDGTCKSSEDCRDQEGFGKVCVQGRCQECGTDADCKEGFVCRANRCVPKPQCTTDSECGAGQRCENERCVARIEEAPAPVTPAVSPECADEAAFTIQFAFDKAVLTSESQGTLQRLAGCLKQAPAKRVVVEGHCDERGSTQYNIALGSRRAEAARKYLGDLGAPTSTETVSFGEEKPLCSDASEGCWSKNRRAEFRINR